MVWIKISTGWGNNHRSKGQMGKDGLVEQTNLTQRDNGLCETKSQH